MDEWKAQYLLEPAPAMTLPEAMAIAYHVLCDRWDGVMFGEHSARTLSQHQWILSERHARIIMDDLRLQHPSVSHAELWDAIRKAGRRYSDEMKVRLYDSEAVQKVLARG